MKILKITYDYPPPWMGLAPGVSELADHQSKLDEIVLLCTGPGQSRWGEGRRLVVKRMPRKLGPLHCYFSYYPAVFLLALNGILRKKFDIIHGTNFHPFYLHFYFLVFRPKIPFVLTLHMNCAERSHLHRTKQDWLTRYVHWPLHTLAEKIGCKVASRVICVSESIRNEAIKWYGIAPEKVHVIENGVNVERFSPDGENIRTKLGIRPDEKVLLYVGRVYYNKNVDVLIQSLVHLPAGTCLIVAGNGEQVEELQKLAMDLGVRERVYFMGYVQYHELPLYYRGADLFCLFSDLEGNPKVVLEAISCGVKALSTKSFQASEFLKKYIEFVDLDEPAVMAGHIKRLLSNPGTDGLDEFRSRCSWDEVAGRIRAIYYGLPVGTPGRAANP